MLYKKPKIAVDMDEVMADPIAKFIALYNRDYDVPLNLEILPGNEIHQHVPEHANMKWFDYINEKGFFRDLEVIKDSQKVMLALQDKYDVFVVSAAMEFRNSLEDKFDWMAEHFPFIDWEHLMFCGQKIVAVDIIIDDRIKNFIGFDGRKLLFSSPHNLLVSDFERVNSWQEVAQKLL